MSNKRVTVEKINLTPCCKNTVPDASSRLFFLSFLLFLSSSFLFFFLFTMRAITIIAFTRARAGASLDGSNIELSKVGNCWRSERKNPRLEERVKGREAAISRLARGAISTTANHGNSAGYSSRYKGITVTVITRPVLLIYFRPIFYSHPYSAEFEDLSLICVNSIKDKFVRSKLLSSCLKLRKRVVLFPRVIL